MMRFPRPGEVFALVGGAFVCIAPIAANSQSAVRRSAVVMVAPIKGELPSARVVGVKKAGLVCLPSGSITYGEVSPDPNEAASYVTAELRSRGIDVYESPKSWAESPSIDSTYVLVGEIKALKINACTPQWGVGKLVTGKRTSKGSGSLTVDWAVYVRASRAKVFSTTEERNFAFKVPSGSLGSIVSGQIALAIDRVVPELTRLSR